MYNMLSPLGDPTHPAQGSFPVALVKAGGVLLHVLAFHWVAKPDLKRLCDMGSTLHLVAISAFRDPCGLSCLFFVFYLFYILVAFILSFKALAQDIVGK